MVEISKIVDDALAKNGVAPTFDHLRLQWSRWFRCDSSFSVLLAPAKPGIFAIAEEIVHVAEEPAPLPAESVAQSFEPCTNDGQAHPDLAAEVSLARKRMLALLEIRETGDIGMALGRLFLPGNPLREKLETGKCFTRYAVIEDSAERSSAYQIFKRWLNEKSNSYQDVA